MSTRKYAALSLLSLLILAISFGLTTACSSSSNAETPTPIPLPKEFQTRLLVTEPLQPLVVNHEYIIRSRVEAPETGVSHVELYVVQFIASASDTQEANILVSSQAPQPLGVITEIFNAEQPFIPKQPGAYVIQVTGYNNVGQSQKSESLRFEVVSGDASNQS